MRSYSANLLDKKIDYEMLFTNALDCYLILNPDFIIVEANKVYLQTTMTDRSAILGRYFFDIFPDNPNDVLSAGGSKMRASFERVLEKGVVDTMAVQKHDIRRPKSEGGGYEERYWSPVNSPVFNNDGKIEYIIHRVEDVTDYIKTKQQNLQQSQITERYQVRTSEMEAEIYKRTQELQCTKNRLDSIMDATSDFIASLDKDFRFIAFNKAFQKEHKKLYGKKISMGMSLKDSLEHLPQEQAKIVAFWQRALAGEKFTVTEKFGDERLAQHFHEINYNAIYDEKQNLIGACQAGRNVTERMQLETDLRTAKEVAELANEHKTKFFSNISHEFRTPLTLMLGPIEDLLEDTLLQQQPERYEQLKLIYRNALRLLRLVNSLLYFTQLEANRLQAYYEPTDLGQLTADLASMFRSAIEKSGLEFHVDIESFDEPVYVDKEMWEKIIFNLLSNALKFTLKGQITVTLAKHQNQVELSVHDTGVGIPASEQSKIFERFHRVNTVHGRSYEGTGIGLALVCELTKTHGGSIKLQSHLGQGSTFTVCLPLGKEHLPAESIGHREAYKLGKLGMAYVEEALGWLPEGALDLPLKASVTSSSSLPGSSRKDTTNKLRILIVDDNADMRQYMKAILKPYWDVKAAENGKLALELILQEKFDLIITDVMMPEMDGFELLKALRVHPTTRLIPVIMLSARASEEARVEGIQAGADDYLVKPFSAKELIARANTHLELGRLRLRLEEQVKARTAELEETYTLLAQQMEEKRLCVEKKLSAEYAHAKVAEEYKRLQEEFIDTICHEIRNPLSGICGSIDLLETLINKLQMLISEQVGLSSELKMHFQQYIDEIKELISILHQCAKQQKVIVNDVLDLSKIEKHKIELSQQVFNPKEIISSAAQMFKPQFAQKNLELIFDMPEDDCQVIGDAARLTQVLANLLSNTVKFTQQGSVKISLAIKSISTTQCDLDISIADTGVGMTPEEVNHLFNRFSQANARTATEYGGSGLGLAISKKLVELMGGTIQVESQKGKGSIFNFTIQCGRVLQSQVSPSDSVAESKMLKSSEQIPLLKQKTILVVDDNPINRKILRKYLQQIGQYYQEAKNGLEALNKSKESVFDIILMDIEMPVMNGLEATRQIRQYEQQLARKPVVIIGLSGNVRQQQIQTALDCGMNDYLTKPYHKQDIENILNKYSSKQIPTNESEFLCAESSTSKTIIQRKAGDELDTEKKPPATLFFKQESRENKDDNLSLAERLNI